MSRANQTHPAPEELRAFALGRLDAAAQAAVEQHVSTCEACCAALRGVPDDTFVDRLRTGRTTSEAAATVAGQDVPEALANHPRYRVLRCLGAGGMGVVFHAEHRLMQRQVALKVIHANLVRNPTALERFLLEVRTAARLAHPNIVTAHDAEQVGDLHFLVMEYVDGISLDRLVARQGPLPVSQACQFIRQAAQGLQHAHEQGLVHRDVKPHNLMVTRKGQVKVLDFGLARLREGSVAEPSGRRLTTLGVVLGTPDYIAPEQVGDSHAVDIRADIYALGCTLYFLLAGRPPFPEGNALEKALSHVDSSPQPLRLLRPDVPRDLIPVLGRMMAKSPADRYQTPAEAAQALAPFIHAAASPPAEAPASPPAAKPREKPAAEGHAPVRLRRAATRGKMWWLAAGGAALGVLLAAILLGLAVRQPGSRGTSGATSLDGPAAPGGAVRPKVLLVLPADGFWYPDYAGVKEGLEKGGAEVVVASSRPGRAVAGKKAVQVPIQITVADALDGDHDAVVFVGALPSSNEFASGPAAADARRLIDKMLRRGRPVAAICAGAIVLANAGTLRGKRAPWPAHVHIRQPLEEGGARIVQEDVVEDGNVLTGRDPRAAHLFTQRLLDRLARAKR